MKRTCKLFLLVVLMFVSVFVLTGCSNGSTSEEIELREKEKQTLKLDCAYELVALEVNEQTVLNGEISSIYLFCSGGTSGKIKTSNEINYSYWYRREDGGMIRNTIDMSSYGIPGTVEVVIYENDNAMPKVEFWRNYNAREIADGVYGAKTEIRFTVPTGSVVDANLQRTDVNITEPKE